VKTVKVFNLIVQIPTDEQKTRMAVPENTPSSQSDTEECKTPDLGGDHLQWMELEWAPEKKKKYIEHVEDLPYVNFAAMNRALNPRPKRSSGIRQFMKA